MIMKTYTFNCKSLLEMQIAYYFLQHIETFLMKLANLLIPLNYN